MSASHARHSICGFKAIHISHTLHTKKKETSKIQVNEILNERTNGPTTINKLHQHFNASWSSECFFLFVCSKTKRKHLRKFKTENSVVRRIHNIFDESNVFMKKVVKFISSLHKRIENSALIFRNFVNSRSIYQRELSVRLKRIRITDKRNVLKRFA